MIEGTEVVATNGVIATGPAEAARVGARIFEQGGGAADAVAAAALACAVLEPQAVDLGGYVAAAVVLYGKTGEVSCIDANSVAPAAAHERMYRILPRRSGKPGINELEYGCSVRDDANVYGPRSVAVPGFVAGVGTLWERFGRMMNWAHIVRPAQDLVENGLTYEGVHDAIVAKRDAIARFPSTAEILLPQGRLPQPRQRWNRKDLGMSLAHLAGHGWRSFYNGELGQTIGDFVESQRGILTRRDMYGFSPRVAETLPGIYRNAEIYTAFPPNGGFSVVSALNELAGLDVLRDDDPRYWHSMAGVLRQMWRERLGDSLPRATPHGTIHLAAADSHGTLVSMTISQGGLFGSCLAVPGTGIILGHGMCRFDPHPRRENSPGAGKRPLNNVCPLIIRTPERDIAIGARGGRRIVSVCVQLAQRIVDFEATSLEAATAPRIHTLGDTLEVSGNFDPEMRSALAAMGHHIETPEEVAGAAYGAEILKATGELRAGGNTWAVGV